mmetsp:Transcript_32807/g.75904  ORF Transcript_32807/g.75904 Transcript_32807/m.75904 type:complete len:444 (+) Transcript_32807:114-1445(+)|eukprot:CAMPEP_0182574660 /NCGR_PEP_ID=MMETSP1324-20130603/26680_1 /TAXON_ID=236786 /ORGANISM="Florenciella sp., Strain RCC1587" /LENGTH=443 /DNA_ID=CAMNT_0024790103 /DNA_START=52 /DNA_END=1383 /DNA_ORIENTATION=-
MRTVSAVAVGLLALASGGAASSSNLDGAVGRVSRRSNIRSFVVMDVLANAQRLEAEGKSIMHMEVGQPGSGAPVAVRESAKTNLGDAPEVPALGYTNAVGIPKLQRCIADYYDRKYGVKDLDPERIFVTTGSSAGFLLTFVACFDVGDVVAVASSGYPCYRNILESLGCEVLHIPVNSDYKVTAAELAKAVEEQARANPSKPIKGLIISSPGNPTGAMLSDGELSDLASTCREHGIQYLSDEIYHGITYGPKETTALECDPDNTIVINSFSKYFSMTGWRLGWLVVPHGLVDRVNRLQQNMFISAPTLSQIAGVAAFSDEADEELQSHLHRYKKNRDTVLAVLGELEVTKDVGSVAPADGAFYVYVDLEKWGVGSKPTSKLTATELCNRLIEEAGVACTPGVDFEDPGNGKGEQRLRFSYSRSEAEVQEAMRRFKAWWTQHMV